jgi:transposase
MTSMAHPAAPQVTVGSTPTWMSTSPTRPINSAAVWIPSRFRHSRWLPGPAGLARRLGEPIAWGVEGTGCYGAALARFLAANGQVVVEVNRPDRAARRRRGKSDSVDAEAAARLCRPAR